MFARFRWLISTFFIVLFTACGMLAAATSTSVPISTTSKPISTPTNTLPSTVTPVTSGVTGAGAQVPNSCDALVSLVGSYIGGVGTTKSLGSPQHLSCEFTNAKASTIVIVNIGAGGTVAAFDALRTTSAQGGRTVKPISGLGASAFSVSKNGVPAGVSVLTAQGFVYVVESNLTIAQDEALIKQLMQLP